MSGKSQLVSTVTWAVMNGLRHFKGLHITSDGLYAQKTINRYDFAAILPARSSISLHTLDQTCGGLDIPLKTGSSNYHEPIPWWPDCNWGTFCLIAYLAQARLLGTGDHGLANYLVHQSIDDPDKVAMGQYCREMQGLSDYTAYIQPVLDDLRQRLSKNNLAGGSKREQESASHDDLEEKFNDAFVHCYCTIKAHGVPLWSSQGVGHPFFANETRFVSTHGATTNHGDVPALLPVIDFALHSSQPNCAIGHLDSESLAWIRQEKDLGTAKVLESPYFFGLQALRDIQIGEPVTIDKNIHYNFDEETFEAWFGYPYDQ